MPTNPGGILSLWKGSIPLGLASVVRHFITGQCGAPLYY